MMQMSEPGTIRAYANSACCFKLAAAPYKFLEASYCFCARASINASNDR